MLLKGLVDLINKQDTSIWTKKINTMVTNSQRLRKRNKVTKK